LLLCPAVLAGLARTVDSWTVRFQAGAEPSAATARVVIDAAGRRSHRLVPHGARWRVDDRLSCSFMRAEAVSLPAGAAHIEVEAEGWWYAAPIPGGASQHLGRRAALKRASRLQAPKPHLASQE
jgi:hypothetical protein